MTKKTIKLTECELQKIVKESVKNVLSEGSYDMNHNFDAESHNAELKEKVKNEAKKINSCIISAIVELDKIARFSTDESVTQKAQQLIRTLNATAKEMNTTNYSILNDEW